MVREDKGSPAVSSYLVIEYSTGTLYIYIHIAILVLRAQ